MSRKPGEPAKEEDEKGLIAVKYAEEMLGDEYSGVVEDLHRIVWKESPLDDKTKHLIALALAAAAGDERRVGLIAETAKNVAGVTDEEIATTLALVAWVEGVSKTTRIWGVLRQ